MEWKRPATLLLVAAGTWTLGAGSWQLDAAGREQSAQTFRSGAQVVQVDVRVMKDGRFITDLGPSDFTIKEDGVAQKIESLALVGAPPAPASSPVPAPASSAEPTAPATSAPSALSAPS